MNLKTESTRTMHEIDVIKSIQVDAVSTMTNRNVFSRIVNCRRLSSNHNDSRHQGRQPRRCVGRTTTIVLSDEDRKLKVNPLSCVERFSIPVSLQIGLPSLCDHIIMSSVMHTTCSLHAGAKISDIWLIQSETVATVVMIITLLHRMMTSFTIFFHNNIYDSAVNL